MWLRVGPPRTGWSVWVRRRGGGLGTSSRRRRSITLSRVVGDAAVKDTRLLAQWLMGYVVVRRAFRKGLITGFAVVLRVCIDRGSVAKWRLGARRVEGPRPR